MAPPFSIYTQFLILAIIVTETNQQEKGFLKIETSKKNNFSNDTVEHNATESITTSTSVTTPSSTTPIATSTTTKRIETSTIQSTSTTTMLTTKKPKDKTTEVAKNTTKLQEIQRQHTFNYFCACNLLQYHCDINCCCDIDCNNDMLKTFDCRDEHYSLRDFQFDNGLPSCKVNEGWLCVFKDNSGKRKFEHFNPNLKNSKAYSWPNPLEYIENEKDRDYYKSGDPVLLYNEQTDEIKTFDLPYSILNSRCQLYEPIRHLKSFTRECILSTDQLQTLNRRLLNYARTTKVLRWPKNVDSSEVMTEKSHEGKGDCIQPKLFYCSDSNSKRHCENGYNTSISEDSEFSYPSLILIEFNHNFTSLVDCKIYIFISQIQATEEQVWQRFEVNFLYLNETNVTRSIVSGPLGYLANQPVIVAKLVLVNETAEDAAKQWIINYFHKNFSHSKDNFKLKEVFSAGGNCMHQSDSFINFMENSFIQCSIGLSNGTIIDKLSNFTTFCEQLQKSAFKYLLGVQNATLDTQIFVSKYGFPKNNTDDWEKIQIKNYETINTLGKFNADTGSFTCRNMIISAKLEFLINREKINGISHQYLIRKINLEFGTRVDLSFALEEEVKLPIYLSVMFYDLTDITSSVSRMMAENLNVFCFVIIVSFLLIV